MMKSTVSTILSGKPPKGINKYMLEEVFFSESCKVGDEYNTDGVVILRTWAVTTSHPRILATFLIFFLDINF